MSSESLKKTVRNDDHTQPGSIQLILGSMFAGKSTELLRLGRRASHAGKKILMLKHDMDTRYHNTKMVTHDGHVSSQHCLTVKTLNDVPEHLLHDIDMIGIDEGQFWHGIVSFCKRWASRGKMIVVSALDGDYKRKPFQAISMLIPLADKVHKIRAMCQQCGRKAPFTHFTKNPSLMQDKNTYIGGDQEYEALCRMCYEKATRGDD